MSNSNASVTSVAQTAKSTAARACNALGGLGGLACGLVQDTHEKFKNEGDAAVAVVSYVINLALFLYAIYLSIQCNNGFNVGSILVACCFAPCYVIYRLAMGNSGCVSRSTKKSSGKKN